MTLFMGDSISTILTIGAIHGFILAVALIFFKRGNPVSNRILAVILSIFSFNILFHVIFHLNYPLDIYIHSFIDRLISILLGPLIFFYVKSKTEVFAFELNKAGHLLPFIVLALAFLATFTALKKNNLLSVANNGLLWFLLVYSFVYLSLSIRLLVQYNRKIKDSFSDINRINLKWLMFLLISFSLIWFSAIFLELHILRLSPCHADYLNLLISIIIYSIGFIGFRKPEAIVGEEQKTVRGGDEKKKKYKKSTLTSEMSEVYFHRLMSYTKKKKPYLSTDINLPSLAKQLCIPAHHLSQVINEKLSQNFFEYVNSFRIKEAKSLISDPKNSHIKIAEIAFMTGFNSISTFNAAFKKNVKITPSQFKKQFLQESIAG